MAAEDIYPSKKIDKTRRLTKSDRAPPNVLAVSFVSLKISIKQRIQKMCFASQIFRKLDAGVMEAITKGPAFGDRKVLHAYVL
jgi:hypothetical protein